MFKKELYDILIYVHKNKILNFVKNQEEKFEVFKKNTFINAYIAYFYTAFYFM